MPKAIDVIPTPARSGSVIINVESNIEQLPQTASGTIIRRIGMSAQGKGGGYRFGIFSIARWIRNPHFEQYGELGSLGLRQWGQTVSYFPSNSLFMVASTSPLLG